MEETMSYRNLSSPLALVAAGIVTMGGAPGVDDARADGVVLIDQSRALAGSVTPGDAPGFPITISVPGTYRLTSNLTVFPERTDGILIAADDVTLDLGGFYIGPGVSGGTGIVTNNSAHTNLVIRNGTIARFSQGVRLEGNRSVAIAGLRVHGLSDFVAVVVGDNASITDSSIYDNHAEGIEVGMNSLVTGNLIFDNGAGGIFGGDGSIISKNTVSGSGGMGGIVCSSFCTINGNVVSSSLSTGITAGAGSIINNNSTTENRGVGIYCELTCSIEANVAIQNGDNEGIQVHCPSVLRGNLGPILQLTSTGCTRIDNIPSP
jgi:hypothetical protein